MKLTRLRVCEEADLRLRILKARTGLTPDLLCRLSFCLSLNDPTPPDPSQYPEDGPREINPYTLIRPWESLILALLRERCHQDSFDEKESEDQFRAHVNRGILLLYKQVHDLSDLAHLIPETCTSTKWRSGALLGALGREQEKPQEDTVKI
jgi:DNA sulfur modification protein DndE